MRKLNRSPLRITAELDSPIEMRDGTILRADIYRPEGTAPTLLVRSPYGEPNLRKCATVPALAAGFAVVLQHVRGRGSSDGVFRPWLDEGDDGFDTIAWIAAQPWSNGDVVMSGTSYMGCCALQAAAARPPALRAVVATTAPHDFYDGLCYYGGAFALGSALSWGIRQTVFGLMHGMAAGEDASFAEISPIRADPRAAQRNLPLSGLTAIPWFPDWVSHPSPDEYWQERAESLRHDQIDVPVMHTGGWFDLFLAGTLENHRRLGGPLTIGPWSHGPATQSVGALDFGFTASGQAAELEQQELAFLSSGGTAAASPVRLFVMGDNVWRDEPAWPLARAVPTRYYLHPDGRLDPNEVSSEQTRSYIHDPADPVPTTGGALLLADAPLVGPQDQREVEARRDVLCYTSDLLTSDVEVTGPLSVTVRASTTAASTDWTAKLVDVWPDGRAISVIDGIVRAATVPGAVTDHLIDLVATSQVFKAGHRIRVEIASSNFPRFDRNLGTGRTGPDFVVAQQTVYPGSWITLPIVPR